MRFVVDTSAILAVRQDEPEREAFHRLLLTDSPHLSVATEAELALVWQARFGTPALADLNAWLHRYNHERPHLGYRNQGRHPWEAVERSSGKEAKRTRDGCQRTKPLFRRCHQGRLPPQFPALPHR